MGHTTSVPKITIRYPFHPLAGKEFHPLRFDEGPPAVYRLELTHRRVSVPQWMTEPGAAEVQVTDALQGFFDDHEGGVVALFPPGVKPTGQFLTSL